MRLWEKTANSVWRICWALFTAVSGGANPARCSRRRKKMRIKVDFNLVPRQFDQSSSWSSLQTNSWDARRKWSRTTIVINKLVSLRGFSTILPAIIFAEIVVGAKLLGIYQR